MIRVHTDIDLSCRYYIDVSFNDSSTYLDKAA